MFKKLKEKFYKMNMVKVQKFKTTFTTVDSVVHNGAETNWIICDRLMCEAEQYIIDKYMAKGYIYDETYTMYIIQNVISINIELIEEKYIPDKFDIYRVIINQDELENI